MNHRRSTRTLATSSKAAEEIVRLAEERFVKEALVVNEAPATHISSSSHASAAQPDPSLPADTASSFSSLSAAQTGASVAADAALSFSALRPSNSTAQLITAVNAILNHSVSSSVRSQISAHLSAASALARAAESSDAQMPVVVHVHPNANHTPLRPAVRTRQSSSATLAVPAEGVLLRRRQALLALNRAMEASSSEAPAQRDETSRPLSTTAFAGSPSSLAPAEIRPAQSRDANSAPGSGGLICSCHQGSLCVMLCSGDLFALCLLVWAEPGRIVRAHALSLIE